MKTAELYTLQDEENKQNHAYETLKQWIISGQLPENTILVERKLCDLLHLSRTPIRSALQRLLLEGFLVATPGRGMMVPRILLEDVIDLFEIRQVLDPLALEFFMQKAQPNLIAAMRETVTEMQEAMENEDAYAFVKADTRFHTIYFYNCGNQRLKRLWLEFSSQEKRISASSLHDRARWEQSYYHHYTIMEKIEAGDISGAVNQLKKHLSDAMTYHIRKMSHM